MKAMVCTRYGSPDVLKLKQVGKPSPTGNEILVKVVAASITTADSMMRQGVPYFGRLFIGLKKPKYPVTGTGFSGVIEAVGSEVGLFSVGDRVFGESVFGYGSHAEYTCVAEDGVLSKLPTSISHETAAPICDGALTSLSFIKDLGKLQSGQHILINGASGSLGSAAVQIARHFGAIVTAVCSTANVEMVQSLGADTVIDYTVTDFTQLTQRYDLIYDSVGKSSFARCKTILKPNGHYLSPVLGFPLLFSMLYSYVFGTQKAHFSATGLRPAKELRPLLNELKALYESGQITTVIDRRYTLKQIALAHRHIDTGHKKGNVVMLGE